jgi:hypothetical protein
MRHPLLKTLIFLTMIPSGGLTAQKLSDGVYLLSGGHEMVAAFKFSADSSFEFYFSYGAVDRSARGHYNVRDGKVHLQSAKEGGKDFTITNRRRSGDGSTVKISDPNSALRKEIVCNFKKGNEMDLQYTDGEGLAHSRLDGCDSILLVHPLYPDIPTVILPGKENHFEGVLNPSLADCSFRGFILTLDKDTLTGSLPYLFEREEVVFIRQKEK